MKITIRFILLIFCLINTTLFAQTQSVGYIDRGDSIRFVFGDEETIIVGKTKINLSSRRGDIKQVNIAGEFNDWNNKNDHFELSKINDRQYAITLSKNVLGKKGEIKQFKFVLNHTYWIEPPDYAVNKITGKDGNTNLFIKL